MVYRPLFIFTLTLVTIVPSSYSQDPQFSQFYANPLYLNPALAGATLCPRLIGNFRDQWPATGGAFITYNGSYDQYVNFLHGGVGLLFTADRTGGGNLNTTSVSLMYAYKFNITSHLYASVALQGGYYQRHLVWENLTFEDMIDAQGQVTLPTSEKPPDYPTVRAPDFSAGIFMGWDDLVYAGFSVAHMTQPRNGFYSDNSTFLYIKYTVHAGSVIDLKKG